MSKTKQEKTIMNPTKIYNDFWIYEEDPNLVPIYPSTCPSNGGYWMMFFDKTSVFKVQLVKSIHQYFRF